MGGFPFEECHVWYSKLWTATKRAAKQRIWTRTSVPPIVFDGDSENRRPKADFGLPGIKKSSFHCFAKIFAQTVFPSGSVCENCPGDFCARIAQGGFEFFLPGQFLKTITVYTHQQAIGTLLC